MYVEVKWVYYEGDGLLRRFRWNDVEKAIEYAKKEIKRFISEMPDVEIRIRRVCHFKRRVYDGDATIETQKITKKTLEATVTYGEGGIQVEKEDYPEDEAEEFEGWGWRETTNQMPAWYRSEAEVFAKEFEVLLPDELARRAFEQLKEEYNLPQEIRFWGWRQSGKENRREIRVSHQPSVALLSHEIAHAVDTADWKCGENHRYHTNSHRELMSEVCAKIMALVKPALDKKWEFVEVVAE